MSDKNISISNHISCENVISKDSLNDKFNYFSPQNIKKKNIIDNKVTKTKFYTKETYNNFKPSFYTKLIMSDIFPTSRSKDPSSSYELNQSKNKSTSFIQSCKKRIISANFPLKPLIKEFEPIKTKSLSKNEGNIFKTRNSFLKLSNSNKN